MKSIQGNVLTPTGFVRGSISFNDAGRIDHIHGTPIGENQARESGQPLVLPGFIDLHVHGGGRRDIMQGGDAGVRVSETHARHGTTAMLATTMTAPKKDLVNPSSTVKRVSY